MSFQWSLQPMLKWMHCIGVYLESPGDNNSQCRFYFVTIYGLILFFINLFCNGMAVTKFIQRFEDHQMSSSSVRWNAAIAATNLLFVTIGSHFSLIFGAYSTWPDLFKILRELEMERFFERKDFQHFRRIYISGLGFLLTVILVLIGTAITIISSAQHLPIMEKLFQIFYPLFLVFVFSGGVLFSCLGWMTSSMLTILAERVIKQMNNSNCNSDNWEKMLATWRNQYFRISRLVDKLDQCYGSLLLVLITASFVMVINSSFKVMRDVSDVGLISNSFIHVLVLIIQFSHFAILAYVPYRIRESAIYLSKQLQQIETNNETLRNNVSIFVLNVLNLPPKITALGLFDVDLRLIPSIIGTTLTYLVILCQFHYSEK